MDLRYLNSKLIISEDMSFVWSDSCEIGITREKVPVKCSGKLPFSEISFKDLLQMARYNPGPASLNSNQGAIQNMLQIMQHVDSSGPLPKDAQHLGEEYSQGQYNPHPTQLQNQYQYNQPQMI